uniref:Uncharacterized protein n=1 Tax=Arundo donax TaxID=35708 RepID=A0A0A9BFZ8_ARUDO
MTTRAKGDKNVINKQSCSTNIKQTDKEVELWARVTK